MVGLHNRIDAIMMSYGHVLTEDEEELLEIIEDYIYELHRSLLIDVEIRIPPWEIDGRPGVRRFDKEGKRSKLKRSVRGLLERVATLLDYADNLTPEQEEFLFRIEEYADDLYRSV